MKILSGFTLLMLGLALASCSDHHAQDHGGHGAHEGDHADEDAKGPLGGRLLENDGFSLEVVIFERGMPPEYRLYPRLDGRAVPPEQVDARIDLRRINGLPGGITDAHVFKPRGNYLVSDLEVHEPHSFDVTVSARFEDRAMAWTYESPEGRVEITPDMATAMKMVVAPVAPGVIRQQRRLYGRITPDPERQRQVRARFPGLVRSVAVQVGDTVTAGQVLARIEINDSLQVVPVTAPIAGLVTRRDINPGEATAGELLFEIVDLSAVWGVLHAFPQDQRLLKAGQRLSLHGDAVDASTEAVIQQVAPLNAPGAPTDLRVVLANTSGQWRPGEAVTATVDVSATPASMMVPLEALQRFRDWDVVFVNEGDRYQALPVELGARDDTHAEVLSGLEPGARIVVGNAYLVKADVEKSGASHDH
jgi:membrane fusion protein, heavy metal efflux system